MTDISIELRKATVFAEIMKRKLISNQHKGGWSNDLFSYLLCRLKEETHELEVALTNGCPPAKITEEAADVANFAMMIADVSGGLDRP